MTTADAIPVRKLRSPADVIDAVPYLVGFHPSDSLVLLSLRGARKRLGLTARVDLPAPGSEAPLAAYVAGALKRDEARSAYAVLYRTAGEPRPGPADEQIGSALSAAFEGQGIEVEDIVLVLGGRFWSLLCRNPACCPAEGRAVHRPGSTPMAAHLVLEGRAPFASRAAMVSLLHPPDAAESERLRPLVKAAARRVPARRDSLAWGRWHRETTRLLDDVVARRVDDASPLGDQELATLLACVRDVHVRDHMDAYVGTDRADTAIALWIEMVRRAPPGFEVAPATMLAWAAYHGGNGGLANIALDRALHGDPSYTLALLLRQALDHAIPPRAWRRPPRTRRSRRR